MSDFISDLCGMTVIDDHMQLVIPSGARTGRRERDYSVHPLGFMSCAPAFTGKIIPRSEWNERIRDLEKAQARIPDLCDALGVRVKNQQQTNFCWANAPVHCLEIMRAIQGQEHVDLSPASVACMINDFKNAGGWGTSALQYLVDVGASPTSLWPDNAIDRHFSNSESFAARKRFQVDEWDDLPTTFDAIASQALEMFPSAIGLNWWGHEVTAVALMKLDGTGRYGMMIDNSWGQSWGTNGRSVLSESKATPDDAVSPRSVTAS